MSDQTEYDKLNNKINDIIKNNSISNAVKKLVMSDLCSSVSEARMLYYQKRGKV